MWRVRAGDGGSDESIDVQEKRVRRAEDEGREPKFDNFLELDFFDDEPNLEKTMPELQRGGIGRLDR